MFSGWMKLFLFDRVSTFKLDKGARLQQGGTYQQELKVDIFVD